MHLRLLVTLIAAAIAVSACTVAVKISDGGLTIEWPKLPDLGIPKF